MNFFIAWQGESGPVTLYLVDPTELWSYSQIATGMTKEDVGLDLTPTLVDIVGQSFRIQAIDNLGTYFSVPFSVVGNVTGTSSSTSSQTSQVSSSHATAPSISPTIGTSLTASATLSINPTPSAISTTTPAQPGLSTGAKAGIGLGTSIGVISLVIIVALFFFKQGRRSEALKRDSAAIPASEKPELGLGKAQVTQTSETGSNGKEIEVKRAAVSELDGRQLHNPAELYSGGS